MFTLLLPPTGGNEFAALLHKKFAFIHSFKDENGRVARLLMNTALIQEGYLTAIIPPVLRQEYVGLLEKAYNDDKPFVEFIVEREKESQKELLQLLNVPIPSYKNPVIFFVTYSSAKTKNVLLSRYGKKSENVDSKMRYS